MPSSDSDGSESLKHGITMTRHFEVVEMSDMSSARAGNAPPFTATSSYKVSTRPPPGPGGTDSMADNMPQRMMDSFKRAPSAKIASRLGYHAHDDMPDPARGRDRFYDVRVANARTADTGLSRELKSRHLQMIAIGGSIGTGLFVASGIALSQSGPASMILAYAFTGMAQFCIMQSLGELSVAFPVAGSFSLFSTRFLDPSWGFAMGWNYACQWLLVLPLEIIAGAMTIRYWNDKLSGVIFVTIFLFFIAVINLFGVKAYGEAEFVFSTVKITGIVGFILLGIVVNIGGTPESGYIGGSFWSSPGPTNNGFKGFCSVLVTSSVSFGGTELVGLAAAEAANPRKTLPGAIRQVFWRIAVFYLVALLLVSLLVPHDDPRLLGGTSSLDASASPFVIAVEGIGATILPGVMNAVILLAVLSVGNSAVFGSSRVLAAMAEQAHAPRIFGYVDRKGRPLAAIVFALSLGLLAYLFDIKVQAQIFDWLLSICALSTLFTWTSICLSHIRFRQAWAAAGNSLNQLPYKSQAGIFGSWFAIVANAFVLAAQFWMAVSPVRESIAPLSSSQMTVNFFHKVLTVPMILLCYIGHKLWFRTRVIPVRSIDINTGRSFSRHQAMSINSNESSSQWPLWKKMYRWLC